MWLGWKRLIPAALGWIMFTAVVNTPDLPQVGRWIAIGTLFLVVMVWVGRGDPRLKGIVTRREAVRSGTA
jgi:hypothetical protein